MSKGRKQGRLQGGLLRASLFVLLCVAVLAAAHWMRLLSAVGIDGLFERQLLNIANLAVDRSMGESIRLIYLDEKGNGDVGNFSDEADRQCLRSYHADLLLKLNRAGARVVAFDLVFQPAITKCSVQNLKFAAAIRAAIQDGRMRVIVGYDPRTELDAAIRREVGEDNLALVRVGREERDAENVRLLTSILLAESDEYPGQPGTVLARPMPMPLALYVADRGPDIDAPLPGLLPEARQVVFTGDGRRLPAIAVDVRNCHASELLCERARPGAHHWLAFLPVWMGDSTVFIERSYASVVLQPELGEDYRDKIVIIGARTPDEVIGRAPESKGKSYWEYQAHARALADLQSNSYLRRPPAWFVVTMLFVLVVLGAAARLWLPQLEMKVSLPWVGSLPLPLGLILVAVAQGLLVILLMRQQYWLQDLGYQVLALAAGYYFASRPLLPTPVKETSKEGSKGKSRGKRA